MHALVARHAGGFDVLQLEDDALGLRLCHPLVEPLQRAPQPFLQQCLALVPALRGQSLPRHIGPSETLEQLARGVLGVVELVELGGRSHLASGFFNSGK